MSAGSLDMSLKRIRFMTTSIGVRLNLEISSDILSFKRKNGMEVYNYEIENCDIDVTITCVCKGQLSG